MPFCPECKYEYEPTVSTCPDCSVSLVAHLPEPKEDRILTPDDWIALARLTSTEYAEMIEDVLRSKDIPVVILSNGGHFAMTGQMGSGSVQPIGGGLSVMVLKENVVEANRECQIILGDAWDDARLIDINKT